MKKIYLAQPMGGRLWGEVDAEAKMAATTVEGYGFSPWAPPLKENVYTNQFDVIRTSPKTLAGFWKLDKAALAKSDALISLRGDMTSEGVGLEIGMAKYHFNIPVVVVAPQAIGRVTHLEADYVAPSLADACEWLWMHFGQKDLVDRPKKKKVNARASRLRVLRGGKRGVSG